ncbi:MAG TPA: HD domain-containing protein [Flexilinea sp.]|jgi:predicted hydrolase (HD superfamily)|nr:MAG: tRNA 2'-O-methylase [Chloroflexi bacterium ADurb.Bin344]HNY94185.1 HD domain-containing protein [Flexilinea sp.]HOG60493.1 HD domain-containing protein [Flexilinea sp.]HOR55715.1 HD domain-containing protein [Flexilinea sp.]HPL56785.1 HD domain-containing protein [Flexilinea sp.]
MENLPSRDQAWDLLTEYISSETLQRHVLTVEGVMRHFAGLYHEDEEEWGIIGLLHDLDYELYPDEHCIKVQEILREKGFPEEFIHAVASHGYGICCDVEPVTNAEKVLFTIDELTGLIYAAALMRPSKSVMDLETKSVMKKFKSPAFAANVNRDLIREGAEKLGMPLEDVITETILGMREIAPLIGLEGEITDK